MRLKIFSKWQQVGKLLAVVAYCLLGIWLVSSRESKSGTEQKIILTLAVPAGHTTDPIYRAAIARFEAENPNAGVRLITVSSGNYYQKVMVMIAGNCAPDLMWMGQSFNEFADKRVFLDLSERIRLSGIDLREYKPKVLDWYKRGEQLYSLPFGEDVSFLFYNRKLFREAGIPFPKDDWEFSEFLEAVQKLTRRDKSGRVTCYGFRGQLEPGTFGASPLHPTDGRVNCNTPEMEEYFRINLDLAYHWHVSPTPEEIQGLDADTLVSFQQERIAMMWAATMNIAQALEVFQGMDFDMTLQPRVKAQSQWASSFTNLHYLYDS